MDGIAAAQAGMDAEKVDLAMFHEPTVHIPNHCKVNAGLKVESCRPNYNDSWRGAL